MANERNSTPTNVLIVTPVFNDWPAFGRLLEEIEAALPAADYDVRVLAVDDCSGAEPLPVRLGGSIERVDVIRLAMNVGHQRAIAIGLAHSRDIGDDVPVAVMDCDGEDAPADLKRLIDHLPASAGQSVVAQRSKRSEGLGFRLFYWIYRRVFRLLTGQHIDFGNFCVLRSAHVDRLLHNANIWNNLAATLVQAKFPLVGLPTTRGRRYAGQSSMNLVSLITHGLGAVSVFSDAVFVRIIIFSSAILASSVLLALTVFGIRLLTHLAIPGWTTNVLGFVLLIAMQAVMLAILVAFLQLSGRAAFTPGPKDHARRFIDAVDRIYERPESLKPD